MQKVKCSQCNENYPNYYIVNSVCYDCYLGNVEENENHFEKRYQYIRFLKENGYTNEEIAKRLNSNRKKIGQILRLQ